MSGRRCGRRRRGDFVHFGHRLPVPPCGGKPRQPVRCGSLTRSDPAHFIKHDEKNRKSCGRQRKSSPADIIVRPRHITKRLHINVGRYHH